MAFLRTTTSRYVPVGSAKADTPGEGKAKYDFIESTIKIPPGASLGTQMVIGGISRIDRRFADVSKMSIRNAVLLEKIADNLEGFSASARAEMAAERRYGRLGGPTGWPEPGDKKKGGFPWWLLALLPFLGGSEGGTAADVTVGRLPIRKPAGQRNRESTERRRIVEERNRVRELERARAEERRRADKATADRESTERRRLIDERNRVRAEEKLKLERLRAEEKLKLERLRAESLVEADRLRGERDAARGERNKLRLRLSDIRARIARPRTTGVETPRPTVPTERRPSPLDERTRFMQEQDDLRRRLNAERLQADAERLAADRDRLILEKEEAKRLEAERQRRLEETRRLEAEREAKLKALDTELKTAQDEARDARAALDKAKANQLIAERDAAANTREADYHRNQARIAQAESNKFREQANRLRNTAEKINRQILIESRRATINQRLIDTLRKKASELEFRADQAERLKVSADSRLALSEANGNASEFKATAAHSDASRLRAENAALNQRLMDAHTRAETVTIEKTVIKEVPVEKVVVKEVVRYTERPVDPRAGVEADALRQQANTLRLEADRLRQQIADQRTTFDAERTSFRSQLERLRVERTALTESFDRERTILKHRESVLETERINLNENITELTQERERLKTAATERNTRNVTLNQQLDQAEDRIKALTQEVEKLREAGRVQPIDRAPVTVVGVEGAIEGERARKPIRMTPAQMAAIERARVRINNRLAASGIDSIKLKGTEITYKGIKYRWLGGQWAIVTAAGKPGRPASALLQQRLTTLASEHIRSDLKPKLEVGEEDFKIKTKHPEVKPVVEAPPEPKPKVTDAKAPRPSVTLHTARALRETMGTLMPGKVLKSSMRWTAILFVPVLMNALYDSFVTYVLTLQQLGLQNQRQRGLSTSEFDRGKKAAADELIRAWRGAFSPVLSAVFLYTIVFEIGMRLAAGTLNIAGALTSKFRLATKGSWPIRAVMAVARLAITFFAGMVAVELASTQLSGPPDQTEPPRIPDPNDATKTILNPKHDGGFTAKLDAWGKKVAGSLGISASNWGSEAIGLYFGEALARKFLHDMDASTIGWADIGDPLAEGVSGIPEAGGAVLQWAKEALTRGGVKVFINKITTGKYLGTGPGASFIQGAIEKAVAGAEWVANVDRSISEALGIDFEQREYRTAEGERAIQSVEMAKATKHLRERRRQWIENRIRVGTMLYQMNADDKGDTKGWIAAQAGETALRARLAIIDNFRYLGGARGNEIRAWEKKRDLVNRYFQGAKPTNEQIFSMLHGTPGFSQDVAIPAGMKEIATSFVTPSLDRELDEDFSLQSRLIKEKTGNKGTETKFERKNRLNEEAREKQSSASSNQSRQSSALSKPAIPAEVGGGDIANVAGVSSAAGQDAVRRVERQQANQIAQGVEPTGAQIQTDNAEAVATQLLGDPALLIENVNATNSSITINSPSATQTDVTSHLTVVDTGGDSNPMGFNPINSNANAVS